MNTINKYIVLILNLMLGLLIMLSSTGCEVEDEELESYDPEPVIHAYLEVGQPFGIVHLEWVNTKIYSIHYPGKTFIPHARVLIYPISDELNHVNFQGEEVDTAFYYVDPEAPIFYQLDPTKPDPGIVQPGWRYRVEASRSDEFNLWAETTSPDTFNVTCTNFASINDVMDSVPVDPQNFSDPFPTFIFGQEVQDGIHLEWTGAWPVTDSSINPVIGYVNNVVALTDEDLLWPLDPDFEAGDELDYEDESRAEIFILPDYISDINLNWLDFKWEGAHRVDVAALSVDYYLYLNSQSDEEEEDTPILLESNVHGGLGCFGAFYQHRFYINVVLP